MIPNKIIISGGWGYANLGDDAILFSTVELVNLKYPNAEIVVMTYDPIVSKQIIEKDNVRFVDSVHRFMVGDDAFKRFGILEGAKDITSANEAPGFFYKLKNKLVSEYYNYFFSIKNKFMYLKYKRILKNLEALPVYDEFVSSDLFILGGGGYFNSEWIDNFYAHVLEVALAKKLNIKSLMIGQSIGPFETDETLSMAKATFHSFNVVSVRDVDSYNDLISYGIEPIINPDTAIATSYLKENKLNVISLILGGRGLNENELEALKISLESVCKECNLKIKIVASRLWANDVLIMKKLHNVLKDVVGVEIIMPANFEELQRIIGETKIMVSQNLHGLILAWRAGVPCVCLTDTRKFISFMKQSAQGNRIVRKHDFNSLFIEKAILDAYYSNDTINNFKSLSDSVKSTFMDCLDKATI